MTITASDGRYNTTLTLTIIVQILNDQAPQLAFLGTSTATFVENSSQPLPIGTIFRPDITDADNNGEFLMERATVMLLDTPDGSREEIGVPEATRTALAGLNISVEGTLSNCQPHLTLTVLHYQWQSDCQSVY